MSEKSKRKIMFVSVLLASVITLISIISISEKAAFSEAVASGYINSSDFNVTALAMKEALNEDMLKREEKKGADWIDTLALIGTRHSCDFSSYRKGDAVNTAEVISQVSKPRLLASDPTHFDYCKKLYSYVLSGFVGEYSENSKTLYGIKGCFPIPEEYGYRITKEQQNSLDLKGTSYIRAKAGTPVVAVEDGTVFNMRHGNGGKWEIVIRSNDNRRYYIYSGIMKDHPFADHREGDSISVGDTVGFINGGGEPSLGFGMCVQFDPRDSDPFSNSVQTYEILKFLEEKRIG